MAASTDRPAPPASGKEAVMRVIRSILRLFLGLFLLGGIASAVAAALARSHLASTGNPEDDEFDLVAIYNGLEFKSSAPAFRRGSVMTWFGGGSIDLRDATLDPLGATLRVRALFGGLELIVPETWRVEQHVLALLGGVGDARDASLVAEDAPVLRLTGWVAFGGVGITSTPNPSADEVDDLVERAAEAGAGG
jgi:hypothetical protein